MEVSLIPNKYGTADLGAVQVEFVAEGAAARLNVAADIGPY